MSEIICLSIKQPWVWAIFNSGKDIENRTWHTPYRGLIYIHSSQTYDKDAPTWIQERLGIKVPEKKELLFGHIIGYAQLTGIKKSASPWAIEGQYHWELSCPTEIPNPIKAKGKLQLWKYSLEEFAGNESFDNSGYPKQLSLF